jgi:hypothetical protein
MIAVALHWWHVSRAWMFAAWEFFTDPAIDLNTDFAPEFDAIERTFAVYVRDRRGNLVFRGPCVQSCMGPEEIELLFIDAGFRDIVIAELVS